MDNAETEFDYATTYEQILPLLLEDHTRNFRNAPDLFHDTFFNRTAETKRFRALTQQDDLDRTIIVTGNAGVGKTSFVYRIAFSKDVKGILPIVADYKASVPQTTEGCLLGFIRNATEQFSALNSPVNGLRPNGPDDISHNIAILVKHIEHVAAQPGAPRILIILDDFDYAEETWYDLLDYFLPFVQSSRCSVILTMRPRLYATLQSYDERLRFYFGRNVEQIDLPPMPAREVLASRLAPVLVLRDSESILKAIADRFRSHGPLDQIVRKLGLKTITDLRRIEFPFTELHNDFIHRVTNGNLREAMSIAIDSILYIMKRGSALETRIEANLPRKVIGREGTLSLFFENDKSRYRLININQNKSASGNSLLYNVLEAIKLNPAINDRFFKMLRPFGHTDKDIDWAVKHLADRQQRLLELKWITHSSRTRILIRSDEYEVTDKGNYYLTMARWKEYHALAGGVGKSLIDAVKRDEC